MGLQGLIATVYSFAVTFATSGISLSVTRLVAEAVGEGEGGERILRAAFIYAAFFGLAASVILFTLSGFIAESVIFDMRVADALRILSLSLLPIALSSVISGYFVAVRRAWKNALTGWLMAWILPSLAQANAIPANILPDIIAHAASSSCLFATNLRRFAPITWAML